ncbi:MAG TPA: hypothetical protein PLI61_13855 [bacterium]|jgi:hypothetical protein|nr:hypothetical protein [bacterium]
MEKEYSDSTLKSMTKKELIELYRNEKQNVKGYAWSLENAIILNEYLNKVLEEKEIKFNNEEYHKYWSKIKESKK